MSVLLALQTISIFATFDSLKSDKERYENVVPFNVTCRSCKVTFSFKPLNDSDCCPVPRVVSVQGARRHFQDRASKCRWRHQSNCRSLSSIRYGSCVPTDLWIQDTDDRYPTAVHVCVQDALAKCFEDCSLFLLFASRGSHSFHFAFSIPTR
ncbi:hypothetical protein BT96DRAFT_672540 [Gymnopus androsaceus JB14]|uniref:Uncharacterized protein n=1 Tax=Gymnopus androsaceus JB14 TaxID=1447944 RepID=A0A6A4HNE4_9AGAR|nr:hypothetical protein BT96DRAFT_672540 [Gymnopus androsaceus JB14]